ncbi:MAG: CAP domain-containing protein [Bosea sp. (in: a-proteobacteria)]
MRLRIFSTAAVFVMGAMLGGCVSTADVTGSTWTSSVSADAPSSANVNQSEVLASVNGYRRSLGLGPVRFDAAVTAAARAQSVAMAQQGVMSHDAGGDFRSRLLSNGVGRAPAVENIAWGTRSFAQTMQMWVASYKHAENMQTPDMTRIGVAVVNTSRGAYWTMVMAGNARR